MLCVDNDHEILDGMRALLGRWQVEVITASTVDEALEKIALAPAVMLVDYHLHDRLDGLETLDALRNACQGPIAGALLTADGRDELKQQARARLPAADQAGEAGFVARVPGGLPRSGGGVRQAPPERRRLRCAPPRIPPVPTCPTTPARC